MTSSCPGSGDQDVDILIVNFNSSEYLDSCLKSIQDHVRASYRIIIVDSGSTEIERSHLHFVLRNLPGKIPHLLIEAGENRGFSSANNLALPHLHAPYTLLLNPDTQFTGDAVRACVTCLETDPRYGCIATMLNNADGTLQVNWYRLPTLTTTIREYLLRQWRYPLPQSLSGPIPVGGVTGAFMMIRKTVIDLVGLFDPGFFMYIEEVDLCKRIRDHGWEIGIVPQPSVIHFGGGSSPDSLQEDLSFEMQRSRLNYIEKHFSDWRRWIALKVVKLGLFIGTLAALFKWCVGKCPFAAVRIRFGVARRVLYCGWWC
jgi:GT2 family glycosyltransferase